LGVVSHPHNSKNKRFAYNLHSKLTVSIVYTTCIHVFVLFVSAVALRRECAMIHFVLLISRQGKVRLTKWYSAYSAKEKARTVREVSAVVLARQQKQCNFLEYKDKKIIYKRYASLYFLACVDDDDNELIVLETIHHFVEVLDRYFGNVCELDLIFNFHKAYHILDELLICGELQEPSKKAILRVTAAQDALMEGSGDSKVSDSKYEI